MQGLDYHSLVLIGRQKMADTERKAMLRAQLGELHTTTRLGFFRRRQTATLQHLPLRPTNPGFQL